MDKKCFNLNAEIFTFDSEIEISRRLMYEWHSQIKLEICFFTFAYISREAFELRKKRLFALQFIMMICIALVSLKCFYYSGL